MLQEICNVFPHVEFPHFHVSVSGIIPLELLAAGLIETSQTREGCGVAQQLAGEELHWLPTGPVAPSGVGGLQEQVFFIGILCGAPATRAMGGGDGDTAVVTLCLQHSLVPVGSPG